MMAKGEGSKLPYGISRDERGAWWYRHYGDHQDSAVGGPYPNREAAMVALLVVMNFPVEDDT